MTIDFKAEQIYQSPANVENQFLYNSPAKSQVAEH